MTVLQSSLLSKAPLSLQHARVTARLPLFLPSSRWLPGNHPKFRSCYGPDSPLRCALRSDGVEVEKGSGSGDGESQFVGLYGLDSAKVEEFGDGSSGLDEGAGWIEGVAGRDGVAEMEAERLVAENAGEDVKLEGRKGKFSIMVFLVGIWGILRRGYERVVVRREWASWFPFWREEKRLEKLISEADANPKDAEKQRALLVELNKHRSVKEAFLLVLGESFSGRDDIWTA